MSQHGLEQGGLAECQRLPDDGRHHRQVHGVADIPVEATDDQPLGRRDRRGGARALGPEAHERTHQDDHAGDSSGTPATRRDAHAQGGCGWRTRQPVSHQGTRPATTPRAP